MDCIKRNEEAYSRTTQKRFKNIYKPGREGTTGTKIEANGIVNQRIYRTGSQKQSGDPRGEAKTGGNIDRLIHTIKEQVDINNAAIAQFFEMQDQLKACLDELIEIREKSQNIE